MYHFLKRCLVEPATSPAFGGDAMENLAELMQRLLEIQSGGRQRSPKLIAEDERLMDALRKRNLAGEPPQTVPSQDNPERTRLKT
jgi:hypothetical protein